MQASKKKNKPKRDRELMEEGSKEDNKTNTEILAYAFSSGASSKSFWQYCRRYLQ